MFIQIQSLLLKMPKHSGYLSGKSKIDHTQENLLGNTESSVDKEIYIFAIL